MQNPLNTDRGKLRMEKLRQLELEQLQWEQEALVMPEYLNRALFLSFESVKTEFSDLDGLSWSRDAAWAEEPTPKLTCTEIDTPEQRRPDTRSPVHSQKFPQHSRPPSRAGMQDTIRAPRLAQPSRGPAGQFFHGDPPNLSLSCHLPGLRSHQYHC